MAAWESFIGDEDDTEPPRTPSPWREDVEDEVRVAPAREAEPPPEAEPRQQRSRVLEVGLNAGEALLGAGIAATSAGVTAAGVCMGAGIAATGACMGAGVAAGSFATGLVAGMVGKKRKRNSRGESVAGDTDDEGDAEGAGLSSGDPPDSADQHMQEVEERVEQAVAAASRKLREALEKARGAEEARQRAERRAEEAERAKAAAEDRACEAEEAREQAERRAQDAEKARLAAEKRAREAERARVRWIFRRSGPARPAGAGEGC